MPRHSQLALPPVELRNSERQNASFRNSEPTTETLSESERIAAELLDEAFRMAGLQTKEIAHLCGVSGSLVDKWRSTDARGCPSFAQLLLLPPSFHFALHKVLNRRFGYARMALTELLEAAGSLAVLAK